MTTPPNDPNQPPPPYGQPPPGYGSQQPGYQQPGYQQSGYGAPAPYGPPPEDTTLSVLVHLSLFVFSLLGPLVIYLIVKDDPTKPMTRHHAAQALNFHLTLLIASLVSALLTLVLIGFLMLLALFVWGIVLAIIAAVAAGRREAYRYPLTITFVR